MSLREVGKIRCYVNPCKSHYQRLLPKRLYQSETSIRKKNGLCSSFDLAPVSGFSQPNYAKNKNESKESQQQPCQKCAKIRNSVKKFFRAKFDVETNDPGTNKTALSEQHHRIRMRLIDYYIDNSDVAESQPVNTTQCFGCDQTKRVSSIRGPPIVSPVCGGSLNACPLGEVFKNFPERVKKVIKIDRPRSLSPRKRIVEKEHYPETSVHETKKPHSRTHHSSMN